MRWRRKRRDVRKLSEWLQEHPDKGSYLFTHDDVYIDYWQSLSWTNQRRLILARDGGLCIYCRAVADHVDHLHPRARGGGNEWWNLAAACAPCNLNKHASVEDWVNAWQRLQADENAAWAAAYFQDGS
jgi:5-methylcytosine-specific restriction endonuclease McrA